MGEDSWHPALHPYPMQRVAMRARSFGAVSWYGALVGLTFIVAFCIPVFAGLRIGGLVPSFVPAWWQGVNEAETTALFPSPFVVNSPGEYLHIPHHPELNPSAEGSFLLTGWFNVRKLPAAGDTVILLSKFDGAPRARNGFALALQRDERAVRPLVFWGDSKTVGRWYDFPEIKVQARQWFMLGLSFSERRYLGLYFGAAPQLGGSIGHTRAASRSQQDTTGSDALTDYQSEESRQSDESLQSSELQLLGGYELSVEVVPSSESPLVAGAFPPRDFRGLIGPLALYSGELPNEVRSILRDAARNPLLPSEVIPSASRKLWIPDAQLSAAENYIAPPETGFVVARPDGKKV